jgi:hypothetical protein
VLSGTGGTDIETRIAACNVFTQQVIEKGAQRGETPLDTAPAEATAVAVCCVLPDRMRIQVVPFSDAALRAPCLSSVAAQRAQWLAACMQAAGNRAGRPVSLLFS